MRIIQTVAKRLLRKSIIIHKAQISKSVYHIRIHSPSLKKVSYRSGYFLRVYCGMGEDIFSREKARSYSVWNFNSTEQTIDIAVNTRSGGTGANWAKRCRPGDAVYFTWHKGQFVIDHTGDNYLLIGDLSTLAHFYEIARHLPADKNVESLIYSGCENDLFPDIDGRTPLSFHHQLSANPTDVIIEKLSAFLLQPAGKPIAYIGGDIRICQSVNRYFSHELEKNDGKIKLKAFWGPVTRALK